ncbi:DNA-directed RNA polymeras-like protein II subunit rpb9 [Amylocarpus encephaloides]|uniref:DNA-directed RNA polymerase subunit n=1 Tax=Amylocarpus encephaloides TaxID=45428 RepID=A0A9P7YJ57_9HELO|nr:DNA-directed RNA polymeras-like protein II subunit rpb9 [Amylocarpus encephaloides]
MGKDDITFRFCSECSNMLYPKEDPDTRQLNFACRTCQYSESATSACVFRNKLNSSTGEVSGVTTDVASDPTLPRSNKTCPKCGHEDAVFFQSQQRTADSGMTLFYVCGNNTCGEVFR